MKTIAQILCATEMWPIRERIYGALHLGAAALLLLFIAGGDLRAAVNLERDFREPPTSAQPWAYWWWLDGAASKEGITADLEAMKQQGISGVLLFDAGVGGPNAPKGQVFMSDGWRELFRHALREADRLKIEVGVNLCSGWNAGGTWVTPEHAAKKLVWSQRDGRRPRRACAQPASASGHDKLLPRYRRAGPAAARLRRATRSPTSN